MIKDPGAIYDPNGLETGPGDPPKPSPPRADTIPVQTADQYLQSVMGTPQAMERAGKSFQFNQDQSDINKFLPDGVTDPSITGQDNALQMGRHQSVLNKVGRRLVNLAPNMAAGLIEIAGYTGALATEWGDNRDYDNALIQAAASLRDPAGTNYARQDQSTLGGSLSDPTWWVDNAAQLIEFAVPFAVAGAGTGSMMEAASTAAATGLRAGATGTAAIRGLGQGLSAGFLAYSEAAQSGNQVFKEVYDFQLNKLTAEGSTPESAREQAKHLAAQSAATTVQLATAMSTSLNLHAVAPYFKTAENIGEDLLRRSLTREAGESTADWASRIRNLNVPLPRSESWAHRAIAMGLEGTEEVVQNIAQVTGTQMGKDGKSAGVLEQFGQISNYIDRASGKDNILSFGLGALGGGLIEFGSQSMIPSRNVQVMDADGKPLQALDRQGELQFNEKGEPVYQTKWVTPRTADKWNAAQAFVSQRDALAKDIDTFGDLQSKYAMALRAGNQVEVDKTRNELFNTAQLYAVRTGMIEPWKTTYENIAAMEPQAAVDAGMAKDLKDTSYKEKAREAVSDLSAYSKEYEKLLTKFGGQYEANAAVKQVVDMVFARKVDLMSWEKVLNRHDAEYNRRMKESDELLKMKDPDGFNDLVNDYSKKYQTAKITQDRFTNDLAELKAASASNDIKILDKYIKKYRAVGINDGDRVSAIKDLIRKIEQTNQRINEQLIAAQDVLINSTAFDQWKEKNRDGSFEDYMSQVQKQYNTDLENTFYKADIDTSRREYEIASRNYADIAEEKSVGGFIKKANNWLEKLKKETDQAREQQTLELARRAKDQSTLTKLDKMVLQQMAERYRNAREDSMQNARRIREQLESLQKQADATSIWKDPVKKTGLLSQIRDAKNALALEEAKTRRYNSLYLDSTVDTSSPDQMVTTEQVTQEDNDTNDNDDDGLPVPIEETPPVPVPEQPIDIPPDVEPPSEIDMLLAEIEGSSLTPEQVENNSSTYEVVKELTRMAYKMPWQVTEALEKIEDKLRAGDIAFSYDLLKPQVAEGFVSQKDAAKLLQLLKDVVDATTEKENIQQQIESPVEQVVEGPSVDSEGPGIPETPVINNLDESSATSFAPEDSGNSSRHAGYKITDVMSIANMTSDYTEVFDEKTQSYRKLNLPSEINKKTNPDVLRPGGVPAGTKIRYEVDTEYDGDANVNDQLAVDEYGKRIKTTEKFTDYADADGNVVRSTSAIGNVPIKIVDTATGRTVGYMRKLDWVTTKYPGTTDYRNVQHVLYDSEGNPVDNMELQTGELLKNRMAIVEQFNNGRRPTEGTVNSKGSGRPILNYKTNLNTESSKVELGFARSNKPENSLLPDESLTLGIVDSGTAYSGYNYPFPKDKAYDNVDLIKGSVVVMLPTANGKYTYAPLVGQRLVEGKRRTAVNTVVRAIELYLLNDGANPQLLDEIKTLENKTGHDISSEQGLKNFIGQYFTYTQSFKNTDTAANAVTSGPKVESFLFNIWDRVATQNKGNIRTGWAYSGRPVVEAKIVNGRLNPEFIQSLEEGFATRSRAVVYTDATRNIKGINSEGTFNDIIYTSDGKWKEIPYPSYNEYVKSFSKTAVYGKNRLDDGTYVYTNNPQISISVHPGQQFPTLRVDENTSSKITAKPKPATETVPEFDQDAAGFFDDLSNYALSVGTKTIQVNEIASAPDGAKQMTVENLEELYNFTSESQRNGKTVQEVFRQLASAGHTFLAEGFNPFSRCL